jgi:peptidoglycan-N-acetylglucosamine deacetylase
MRFTTSWDDGYAIDLKVSDLLLRYDATGTFYVCPKNQFDESMLTEDEIRILSTKHEVGAHSINHPKLTKISLEEAQKEIIESKKWIEMITGKSCKMFCYPYGDCNEDVAKLVKGAGYKGARTTKSLHFGAHDPYRMPTTLHLYPFPWRKRWKRWQHFFNPLSHDLAYWKNLTSYRFSLTAYTSWLNLAKVLFTHGLQSNAPFFHLWGHSEEIERFGMWKQLENFMKFVQEHDVVHVTNADLTENMS